MKTAGESFLNRKVFRLRLRTWGLLGLVFPLLLWGFLNLLFSTSWGTGILESRIEARFGLANKIGSVTWSPWAGVTIREVRILPFEGGNEGRDLCRIEEISVDPSWLSLMEGKKRWEELRIRRGEGAISIEQLRLIVARFQKKKVPTPPSRSPEKPVDVDLDEPKPTVTEPSDEGGISPSVASDSDTSAQEEVAEAPVAVVVPVDDFEGSVIFEECRFEIDSEKMPSFRVEVGEIEGDLPVWGGERSGSLRIGDLVIADRFSGGNLEVPLEWKEGVLSIKTHEMKTFGLNLKLSGALRLNSNLPFGIGVQLPDQQVDLSTIYGAKRSPVSAERFYSRMVLQGYLLNPGSIAGVYVGSFENLVFHDLRDGGETRFTHGAGSARFNSAGLIAEDFRAIGDDDAILMNGFVTAGGEAAATVRIVSSPERADSHEKRVNQVSPNLSLQFKPLVTPDREFRDLRIEARAGTLAIDLGPKEEWVPFLPTFQAVLGSPENKLSTLP